jgi:hypothetical protein
MRPKFLQVPTEDIERLGGDITSIASATVLALVRFKLNGRDNLVTIEDKEWWQASHSDIAVLLGMVDENGVPRHDTVQRLMRRLEKAGELQRVQAGTKGGVARVMAYRIPAEQQLRTSASLATSDYADVRPQLNGHGAMDANVRPLGRECASRRDADLRNAPLYTEEEEKRTEGGEVAYLSWLVPPPLFCPEHPNGGIPCGACGDLKRIGKRWERSPAGRAWRQREEGADQKAVGWAELGRRRMTTPALPPPPAPDAIDPRRDGSA